MNKIYLWLILMVHAFYSFCNEDTSQKKTLLITGGAGYIGSHVNKYLFDAGYQTIVLDNLYSGTENSIYKSIFIKGDFGDKKLLDQIFEKYSVDAVLHFAAYKYVGESVKDPLKYYSNNVASTINLLETMLKNNVKVFIFSSSAAIFGTPECEVISENHPCNPINPYGKSKLMVEMILKDLGYSYGLKYSCLRYFNAAGGDPAGVIKNHQSNENNLIPLVLRNIQQKNINITVYGTDHPTRDGTCIRDFVHVMDLGAAHFIILEKIFKGESSLYYNLGNGKGYSVKEVISAAEKVTQKKVHIIEAERREGDPSILISASEKAKKELHWEPHFSTLEVMIDHAWNAMQ